MPNKQALIKLNREQMIRLLVSVKDAAEALDAVEAGADFIDLKDPSAGALGNLNNAICQNILQEVKQRAVISATVGDTHESLQILLNQIDEKWDLGVNIVKLPMSHFFEQAGFLQALHARTHAKKMKLIAVMFAEQPIDLSWIPVLANLGFYGVMIDTANKGQHLLSALNTDILEEFVKQCGQFGLQAGLAGALRIEYLDVLLGLRPNYVGFRSGVCEQNVRKNKLLPHRVKEIKDKLHKHNNFYNKIGH